MSWKQILSITSVVTKWIDDWKSGATERRLHKVQKLKDRLKDVEKDLLKYKNFQNTHDYRAYVRLLNDKRVLRRKIDSLAR